MADFIHRLEHSFCVAYGQDGIASENARDELLHGQLHEGLRYEIIKAPGVSGVDSYGSLCIAAKNEEPRLKKMQQYSKAEGKPLPRAPPPELLLAMIRPALALCSFRRPSANEVPHLKALDTLATTCSSTSGNTTLVVSRPPGTGQNLSMLPRGRGLWDADESASISLESAESNMYVEVGVNTTDILKRQRYFM